LPGRGGLPQMARQHAMLGGQRSELLSERGYSIRIGRYQVRPRKNLLITN
jgi:hypothetical protein